MMLARSFRKELDAEYERGREDAFRGIGSGMSLLPPIHPFGEWLNRAYETGFADGVRALDALRRAIESTHEEDGI